MTSKSPPTPDFRRCPACGSVIGTHHTFCGGCGFRFGHEKHASSKGLGTKTVIIFIAGSFGVLVALIAAFMFFAPKTSAPLGRTQNAEMSSATPTPTPTPSPTNAEKLAAAQLKVTNTDNSTTIRDGLATLKEFHKGDAEYREAQASIRLGEKNLRLAEAGEKRQRDREVAERAETDLIGPKPENSSWDGKVRCVDKYLQNVLNDYDSAEYVEWSEASKVDVKGEPYWVVRLKLRATNAFGGKILKNTYYFIRHNQVIYAQGLSGD